MAGHSSPAAAPGRSLSLVIPAFNEALTIHQAIVEAEAALRCLTDDYEILVVDDGSQDGTSDVVREAARQRPNVRLLRHPVNRGYGAALRTGFEASRCAHVAFTDADCQFDLADLGRLLPLAETHAIVVGQRVQRQDPWPRRFYSRGYNLLVRALLGTGVRDCDCALKVFRRETLAALLPESTGFLVNAEMLARARQRGERVVEIGVRHRPRSNGSSKVSLLDIPRTLASLLPFWWSRVLFAGPPQDRETRRHGDTETRRHGDTETRRHGDRARSVSLSPCLPVSVSPCLLLALAAFLLFFTRLSCPLLEPTEARYAEIPRQMLEAESWLTPVLHGEPYLDKPPLLYWLVMGSYTLFGVHDWAARLVPGLAGFMTVLVTYLWGRWALGPRAGLAGALVLCLSARYVYLGRMLSMDTLLCLCVTASLAAGHVAVRGPGLRRGWWLLSAALCGLGLLTKGPVVLVLIAGPLLAYQLLDPRTVRPRLDAGLAYLAGSLAVAGPWFTAMALRQPGFLEHFFWQHHVIRFTAAFDHQEPLWFYLPGLLLGMLPGTLLLPGMVRFLGRRSGRAAARRPEALGLFLLASLGCLVFFSLADCKRTLYILPAMPTLALALGWYLDLRLPRRQLREVGEALWRRASRLAHRVTIGVLLVSLIGSIVAAAAGLWTTETAALAAGAAVLALAVAAGWAPRLTRTWAMSAAVMFVVLLTAVHQLLPSYARKFSLRGCVRPHAETMAERTAPVVCYPRRWDSVSFYLRRDDVRVYGHEQRLELLAELRRQPRTLLFVKSGKALEELLRDLPAGLEYQARGRQGNVRVGWVYSRWEGGADGYASRAGVPERTESFQDAGSD